MGDVPTMPFDDWCESVAAARAAMLPVLISRMRWTEAEIRAHQTRRLRRLLSHAIEKSPFHSDRLRGIDAARICIEDLPGLPIMDRAALMENFDGILTDSRLNLGKAERAIAGAGKKAFLLPGGHIVLTSGGSSGLRGIFVTDIDGYVETSGGVARHIVQKILERPADAGQPVIASVVAPSAAHGTGLAAALNSRTSKVARFVWLSVAEPAGELIAKLNALRPHFLIGYPGTLAFLAGEQNAGRLCIAPELVFPTTDMVSPALRAAIGSGFDAPIMDIYGSAEGLMGVTEPDGTVFTFNSDTCIVELVDDGGQPVPPGTASAHVLVTNLVSLVQPLIRCRVDDRFMQQPPAPEHGHLRATVQGRTSILLRYGATEIHALVLRNVLLTWPAVRDYQVRQTTTGVDVSLVCAPDVDTGSLAARLRAVLVDAGVAAPDVRILRTAALSPDPVSGKIRRFIPLPQ